MKHINTRAETASIGVGDQLGIVRRKCGIRQGKYGAAETTAGESCADHVRHLTQALHKVIKLWRAVLEEVARAFMGCMKEASQSCSVAVAQGGERLAHATVFGGHVQR